MRITCISLNSCVDRILLAENFRIGSHCQARLLSEQPAGKAVNVARLLATLGVSNRLVALVGEDRCAFFRRHLGRLPRLRVNLISASVRTRMNTTILEQRARIETHIREQGEELPARAWRALGRALADDRSAWVVFCGTLPPGLKAKQFGDLLRCLQRAGKKTAVDASGSALAEALRAGADLIKPNRAELAELLGRSGRQAQRLDLAAAAAHLRREQPQVEILASDGENGAYFVGADGAWHAKATGACQIVSTVGAGDALFAGFLWGMVRQETRAQCLRRAILVATASLACPAAGEIEQRLLRHPGRLGIRVWCLDRQRLPP
ncbi:MAG: PfkB family carbohydrate kinase [Planctomycetota bacterium]|nr:PfkB family carbohydrate kinase [Planctomycetota bacterium]